jgi:PAS domain S-box-containing protein
MSHAAEKRTETNLSPATVLAWYQITLSAIGDAVITTDPAGFITYLNPVAEVLTGWMAAEAHGRPSEEVIRVVNEMTRKPVDLPVRKVIATGLVHGLAHHTILIAKDEVERFIDDSAAPVRDEGGQLVGVVMVFRDISEARAQEQAVSDALVYADSIIDTVRDPILVLDAHLRVRTASRSFYQDFKVKPDETEGRLVYELGNGQWNIPQLRLLLEEILPKNGSFQDFEVKHEFEGIGQRRMLLNARKVYRPGDHSELILLAIEDVTPVWRTGVDFADTRERYRVIVEGATSYAIFTFDTTGAITSWNAGATTMLGYTESEIIGQNFRIIFTPEDLRDKQAEEEMRIAALEGKALDERWHLRKGDQPFWAQGLVMPLQDDEGQTRGFLKIIRDMTDKRRLEDALKKRTDELEEADLHKNEFLAMLAHELRNPLAAIRNAVTLATRSGTREDLEWSRDVTARQVKNFAHLIDDLLDVSRITQGKILLRKEVADAEPILRHAVEAVRPLIEERKHELLISPDLTIEADTTRLEQMVVNLLANAAKYTLSGGRILLIAGVENGNFLCKVRDNGVGISAELLPRMFDLFAQADQSLARSEGGLGIGLTLVRSLVELHGGTISARSEGPGKGSEFELRIPVGSTVRTTKKNSSGPNENSSVRNFRILVVDDNEDTAKGMVKLLKLSGYTVKMAHTGPEAISAAKEHHPEVVILDIGLPGMDGYQVAEALRQEECCKDAMIVAVSGYGEEQARQRSIEAGFDDHLVKPVDFDTLLGVLSRRDGSGNRGVEIEKNRP